MQKTLERAGWNINDVDLIELNEAFAVQAVAITRELCIDPAKLNVNGGAVALGHPIGASGLRMLYEIYHQLLGRAGERQIKDMKLGLAHNLGGNPGSFTCSIIALGNP